MTRNFKLFLGGLAALAIAPLIAVAVSERAGFVAGGALVNLGFRLQDPLERFDFVHDEAISPQEVWAELDEQNGLAASVRTRFPRSPRHPLVAMLVCMDARLDTDDLVGDTRKYYYVLRTAGSVLSEKEEEMLELAVEHGVKVIVLATHTDCAAERVAGNPELRKHYPSLSTAVDERARREAELLARPAIAGRIAAGKLLVKRVVIETATERMSERR